MPINLSQTGMLDGATSMSEKCSQNKDICRDMSMFWGKTNMILGPLTAIMSGVTTSLTYSNNETLVHTTAILATVLVAFMTATNPSAREIERHDNYVACSNLEDELRDFIGRLNGRLSWQNLEQLAEEYKTLCQQYSQLKNDVRTFQ